MTLAEWHAWFDWSVTPPESNGSNEGAVAIMRQSLADEVGKNLFARGGRDLESLGLGVVIPTFNDADLPTLVHSSVGREILQGTIRLLGVIGNTPGQRQGRDPEERAPRAVQRWYHQVEEHLGLENGSLLRWAGKRCRTVASSAIDGSCNSINAS